HWQLLGAATLEPTRALEPAACWTVAIAAGMIAVLDLAARLAARHLAAKRRGAAGGQQTQRALHLVTRRGRFEERRAVITQNLSQRQLAVGGAAKGASAAGTPGNCSSGLCTCRRPVKVTCV